MSVAPLGGLAAGLAGLAGVGGALARRGGGAHGLTGAGERRDAGRQVGRRDDTGGAAVGARVLVVGVDDLEVDTDLRSGGRVVVGVGVGHLEGLAADGDGLGVLALGA